MYRIIAISGKSGHGKSYASDFFARAFLGFKKTAFGEHLKDICSLSTNDSILAYHNQKTKKLCPEHFGITRREVMKKVSRSFKDIFGEDYFVKMAHLRNERHSDLIYEDLRFDVEMKYINKYNGITIRIERPGYVNEGVDPNDISETELDNYKGWDYVVMNNGTLEQLHEKLADIVKDIKGREWL